MGFICHAVAPGRNVHGAGQDAKRRLLFTMTTSTLSPEPKPMLPPNVDLAMDALAFAAESAERGERTAPRSSTEADVRAAFEKDPTKVRAYLDRVIMGNDPELGLDLLLETNALTVIFPEVHAMVGFDDGEWRHKDVWKHTKQG